MAAYYRPVPKRQLTDAELAAIDAEAAFHASLPRIGALLRSDERPWYFLADPHGEVPRVSEASQRDEPVGLASLVIAYGSTSDRWAWVGWYAPRGNMSAAEDAELCRGDLALRLVLHSSEVGEGEKDPALVGQRMAEAPSKPWHASKLEVDGRELPAWTIRELDDQVTMTMVDSLTIFVQSRRWDGPLALRSSADRPDVSSWDDL